MKLNDLNNIHFTQNVTQELFHRAKSVVLSYKTENKGRIRSLVDDVSISTKRTQKLSLHTLFPESGLMMGTIRLF